MEENLDYRAGIEHLHHIGCYTCGVSTIVTDFLRADPNRINLGNLIGHILNESRYSDSRTRTAVRLIKSSVDKARSKGGSSLLIQMMEGGNYNTAPHGLCVDGYLPEKTIALPLFGRSYWDEAGTEPLMSLNLIVVEREERDLYYQKSLAAKSSLGALVRLINETKELAHAQFGIRAI